MPVDPRLVAVGIEAAPVVIGMLREAFARKHPDAIAPTDEEVIAAYQEALRSSLAKDAAWLAQHPGA